MLSYTGHCRRLYEGWGDVGPLAFAGPPSALPSSTGPSLKRRRSDTAMLLHLAILKGVSGNDKLKGGAGHDRLYGGSGHDDLLGGNGNDTMFGESGDDVLAGGEGNDNLLGGDGNDYLAGGAGSDWMFGGAGLDGFAFADFNGGFNPAVGDWDDIIWDYDDLSDSFIFDGVADDTSDLFLIYFDGSALT